GSSGLRDRTPPAAVTRATAPRASWTQRPSVRLAVALAEEFSDRRVAVRRLTVNAIAGFDRAGIGLGLGVPGELLRGRRLAPGRRGGPLAMPLALRTRTFLPLRLPEPAAVGLILLRTGSRLHTGGSEHRAD